MQSINFARILQLNDVVEMSAELIDRAADVAAKHALRGYDTIQIAAALAVHDAAQTIGSTLTVVSADDELNAAAVLEGMQVENPNLHP